MALLEDSPLRRLVLLALVLVGCVLPLKALVAQDSQDPATQAASLIEAAIKARGGDRYLQFKTLTAQGHYTYFERGVSTVPTPFLDIIMWPDKERVEFGKGKKKDRRIQANVGSTGWVYDGDTETLKDQTEPQRREFLDGIEVDIDHLLKGGWKADGVRVRYAGREETRPGERADVVEVQLRSDRKVYFALDRHSHLPISVTFESLSDQGLSKNEYRFAQYIPYDGVQFPNIVDFYRDGLQVSRVNYQSIRLDLPVDESIFAKPANSKSIK